jgi:hypothetical protein
VLSDDIEIIIKRDLNRLPVLGEERWVPKARSSPWALKWSMRAGVLAAAVALALALGLVLGNVRDRIGTAASTIQPTVPAATSQAPFAVVSRQSVLAHVRGLTAIVPRAQRFEAKLLSSAEVPARLVGPTGSLFWLVAVSGEVNCIRCAVLPLEPFHSALFLFDAHSGNVVASEQGPAFWPDGFDALPDRSRSAGSRSLVGTVLTVSGNVIEFQSAESPDRLRLVADENTAYAWAVGLAGGSAVTIDELQKWLHLLAGVTFDPIARSGGTFRLETLRTGVATK